MKLAATLAINASGTSEGAEKGWDSRGRGRKHDPDAVIHIKDTGKETPKEYFQGKHPEFGKFQKTSGGFGGKMPTTFYKSPNGESVSLGRFGHRDWHPEYRVYESDPNRSFLVHIVHSGTKESAGKYLQDRYGINHKFRPPKKSVYDRPIW